MVTCSVPGDCKNFSNSAELKGGSLPLSNSLDVACVTKCLLSFFMMTVPVLLCNGSTSKYPE